MPLSQGDSPSWYEEYIPEDDTAVGFHRGHLEALNVRNAQPGWHYYYAANNTSSIIRFLNQGWIAVDANEPERYGAKALGDSWKLPANLGTEHAYKDVILMKIPMDQYRELQRQKDDYKKSQLEGVVTTFTERGAERLRELHRPPSGKPLYYVGAEHGQWVEEK